MTGSGIFVLSVEGRRWLWNSRGVRKFLWYCWDRTAAGVNGHAKIPRKVISHDYELDCPLDAGA